MSIYFKPTLVLWILGSLGFSFSSKYPSWTFSSVFLINVLNFLLTWGALIFFANVAFDLKISMFRIFVVAACASLLYGLTVASSIKHAGRNRNG